MPNIETMFPSRWITSDTLAGREFDLTIREVAAEVIGDKTKYVVYFDESKAGLVLNKTNAASIAQVHGPESDLWIGKRIRLYTDQATWQGKAVPAVRVRMEAPAALRAAEAEEGPPLPPEPTHDDPEIPF